MTAPVLLSPCCILPDFVLNVKAAIFFTALTNYLLRSYGIQFWKWNVFLANCTGRTLIVCVCCKICCQFIFCLFLIVCTWSFSMYSLFKIPSTIPYHQRGRSKYIYCTMFCFISWCRNVDLTRAEICKIFTPVWGVFLDLLTIEWHSSYMTSTAKHSIMITKKWMFLLMNGFLMLCE